MEPYYRNDSVTLYCGDCLEIMDGVRFNADMILTDPPYMIGAASVGNSNAKSGGWPDAMNASLWYAEWIKAATEKTRVGFIFSNWRSIPTMFKAFSSCQLQINNLIVWDKQWIGPAGATQFRPRYELIIFFSDADVIDRAAPDIVATKWMAGQNKTTGHPAEKPVALLEKMMSFFPDRKLIFDPFGGSGSTGIAAIKTGRRAILIEQDERYCEIAARRIEKEAEQPELFGPNEQPTLEGMPCD